MSISINKYISDSGFCSRRQADALIEQGRVYINEQLALKGNRVEEKDVVYIDDEPLKKQNKVVYIALNKPKGITCTTDRSDKTNIIDFVNFHQRIFPIGRLDKLSDGLIFLTNDGNIVNKILRSSNQHEKQYLVYVDKPITQEFVDTMKKGVKIDGVWTKKCQVIPKGKNAFTIILKQGLNRQIRKMCETLGYKVITLTRTRIMHITLHNIKPGTWRFFTPQEIKELNVLLKDSNN
ncbi:MAG: pseudouridine synthase [Chitinophagaceae bacterium]